MTNAAAHLPPLPKQVGFFARFYAVALLFLIAALLASSGAQLNFPPLRFAAGLCAVVALGLLSGQVWAKFLCYGVLGLLCAGALGALGFVFVQSIRHGALGTDFLWTLIVCAICVAGCGYAMVTTRAVYAEQALRRARRIALYGSAR